MVREQAPAQRRGRLESWLTTLDTHGVQFLILNKQRDRRLLKLVRSRSGWAVDFEDRESVLFTRIRTPQGAGTAA
jgi:hypothetical protein